MAIQICKHLKLPAAEGSSRILAEWAFYKVLFDWVWIVMSEVNSES